MPRIALLIADNLASDAPDRRKDVAEFDHELAVLQAGAAPRGVDIVPARWTGPASAFDAFDAALALSVWDYQDQPHAFLDRLAALERAGVSVFNPLDLIAWNIRKTYLRDLAARGAPVIPTRWSGAPDSADIAAAFAAFESDEVVLKRQVGAGARAQQRLRRGEAIPAGPLLDRAGMIQPYIPAVVAEGEFSFLFIDGAFSHAVLKKAAAQDYRIQAAYGGRAFAIDPAAADLDQARAVMAALDAPPLYARVDMVRGADGRLLLMELELIEPFLYPVPGAPVGDMLAEALLRRLR